MKYRKFGKLDYQISALGFGCMRLPTFDNKPMSGNIDEEQSIRLIRSAIDRGVNYIDTAYPYHNGNSEIVTGKALGDGYRQRVKLATKSPLWFITGPDDFDKFLNEQLKKLQTDHIDFYLMHGLDDEKWKNVVLKCDLLKKAEGAIKDGRINHLGFSFHDKHESFNQIVDGYDKWDFCQLQYNYMDTMNQAGTEGLRYASSKGLAVIVMEPLLGGRLANPPEQVSRIIKDYNIQRSAAQWALQWVWNQPGVTAVLSGMNSMQQLDENLQSAQALSDQPLSPQDLAFIAHLRETFLSRATIPCTKCGYCLPCPQGIDIPRVLELYNNGIMYDDMSASQFIYKRFFTEAQRASACAQCGQCEQKCPQKIKISTMMPIIDEKLK
ncbi:MAG: aldo/keto reductase [Endomicrobiales bacterium]|jgi:predicted aldo/keto reductase-like oxidoreductase